MLVLLFHQLKINHLLQFCGEGTSKGQGCNVAYFLIDKIFERKFLTECSWTGVGRGKAKIAFRSFDQVLSLFYDIVHAADVDFKKIDLEKFIKSQLKNSTKRSMSSNMRKSTKKCRAKGVSAGKKPKLLESEEQQVMDNDLNSFNDTSSDDDFSN